MPPKAKTGLGLWRAIRLARTGPSAARPGWLAVGKTADRIKPSTHPALRQAAGEWAAAVMRPHRRARSPAAAPIRASGRCTPPQAHRSLLVAFVKGDPIDWSAAGLPDVSALPAIQWRRRNLDKLTAERRGELADLLVQALKR